MKIVCISKKLVFQGTRTFSLSFCMWKFHTIPQIKNACCKCVTSIGILMLFLSDKHSLYYRNVWYGIFETLNYLTDLNVSSYFIKLSHNIMLYCL